MMIFLALGIAAPAIIAAFATGAKTVPMARLPDFSRSVP
jgi:hypothetical protein